MTPIKVATITYLAIRFSDEEQLFIRADGLVVFPPNTVGVAYNPRTLEFFSRLIDEITEHNRWAESAPAVEP